MLIKPNCPSTPCLVYICTLKSNSYSKGIGHTSGPFLAEMEPKTTWSSWFIKLSLFWSTLLCYWPRGLHYNAAISASFQLPNAYFVICVDGIKTASHFEDSMTSESISSKSPSNFKISLVFLEKFWYWIIKKSHSVLTFTVFKVSSIPCADRSKLPTALPNSGYRTIGLSRILLFGFFIIYPKTRVEHVIDHGKIQSKSYIP